jgi:hypothetical protein
MFCRYLILTKGDKMSVEEDSKKKQYKKFQKLDEAWRTDMMALDTPSVYKKIQEVAINDVQLTMAKNFDEDLKKLKEQVKVANEPYSQGAKENKIRLEYLLETLRSRGEDVPSVSDFIKEAANGELNESEG